MKSIYVLDAVNFLFRSYYAIGPMTNPKGESTGALYGFIRTLLKLVKEHAPTHLVAVFDGPGNAQSRREIYAEYKAHRTGMPEDLFPQLEWAVEFCKLASVPYLMVPGVEADDVMGSIAKWAEKKNTTTYLCSSDKDLCQLVSDHTFVLNVHKNNLKLDREGVKDKFGVFPEQIIDYLAMVGDTSDNIPGIDGIGPKTASQLLTEHGTLDALLKDPSSLSPKKQETFIAARKTAPLSQQLATIDTKIDFPKEEDFYRLKEPDLHKLKAFYEEMHFLSLLKELNLPPAPSEELDLDFGVDATKETYVLINDEKELHALIEKLQKAKTLCVDTETTSIKPLEADLVGIGLSDEPHHGWYIPINGTIAKERVIELCKSLLENPAIGFFGQNIKYDLHVLKRAGIEIQNVCFDTMLASYLIAPNKQRHNLDTLCLENFHKVKTPTSDLIGKGKKQITMDQVPLEKVAAYCCEDVDYTFRLKERFAPQIAQKELDDLYTSLELPLISVLQTMEENGIFVDLQKLQQMGQELQKQIDTLMEAIFKEAGETFNLNSPKQLGVVLFEKMGITPAKKTATGYSTAADILESLRDKAPIIDYILQYRTLEKLRSTYVATLPEQINPHTHRIHCTYNQTVAATGRLSSQDPNLQNIPIRTEEGRKIRTAFIPQNPNWSFLAADYSQIELRLLAHLSDDPTLIEAFVQGEDIHRYTASLVYGVPLDEVTSQMRYAAKAVNFGILYGQGPFGLSKEIGTSIDEAKQFIETYFARYPKVKGYLEDCKKQARTLGFSTTLIGRKRPIPEMGSKNAFIRQAAERLAVNTPLQGTAADLIKMAMLDIQKWLDERQLKTKMILQIHDELVFETPPEELDIVRDTVKTIMESVFKLKIPLVVDISVGKNWGEC